MIMFKYPALYYNQYLLSYFTFFLGNKIRDGGVEEEKSGARTRTMDLQLMRL